MIGMVGLIDDIAHITRATFQHDGDAILLLGEMGGELGASEYLATIHGAVVGPPPRCDVKVERRVIDVLLDAIRTGAVRSAHDCSDGGLAVALAECCIANLEGQTGAEIDLSSWADVPDRAVLFGESQGRIVLSSPSPARILAIATTAGVPCAVIDESAAAGTLLSSSRRSPVGARLKASAARTTRRFRASCRERLSTRRSTSWLPWRRTRMCGIFGIHGHEHAAAMAHLGLYSLQHRGQESSGIVAVDRDRGARAIKSMGLVSEALSGGGRRDYRRHRNRHTRYRTRLILDRNAQRCGKIPRRAHSHGPQWNITNAASYGAS